MPPRPAITWPARALGATVAAGLAAWLAAAPLTSAAVAPAVAAVAAGLAVLVLPRLGWLALAVATAGWLAGEGAGGAAFAILLGALLPVVLLFRHPARWPLAAIAPALALAGLAGAWPAIAARAPSAWQRAALAITGWIWLVLAAPLAGIEPYVRAAPGVPSRSVWMGSPYDAVNHLLSPLLRSGVLAPALVWAVAAVVLPPIVRSRPLSTRIVIVTAWSVGLLAGTAVVFAALQPAGTLTLGTAVLGAVAAGVAAMIPEGRRHRAGAAAVPATDPGLA